MGVNRRRVWVGLLVAVAGGCTRESPALPPVAVAVADPTPDAPTPAAAPAPAAAQTQPPAPPPPPPAFPFPDDLAGKELPKVVTPRPPAPPPVEKFGAAPVPRTPPARVVNPDVPAKVTYAPPPALPPRPAGVLPTAPAERLPLDLGTGVTGPTRPTLAVAKSEPVRAPDVATPPPLVSLARPVPDRASLDDPAAEPAGVLIVNRTVTPTLGMAEFLRLVLPDPFELAAQVRPVVPTTADPGLNPVPVNPMRPR